MGHHVSTGPSSGGGTPRRGSSGGGAAPRATPSAPAYLSPAFQLAAMEQEVQMAHAEAHQEQQQQQQQQQAAQAGGNGATPSSAAGAWQTDDASEWAGCAACGGSLPRPCCRIHPVHLPVSAVLPPFEQCTRH